MLTTVIEARRYETGEPVRINIQTGRINRIVPLEINDTAQRVLPWVAPGFLDIQINGYNGCWFCDSSLTVEKVAQTLKAMFPFGVNQVCPTLTTHSFEFLAAGVTAIRRACDSERWIEDMVACIHLEGPHISPQDGPRGAHPQKHVRSPDWEEFCRLQELAGGRSGLVTLAPELPGALDFIRQLVDSGIKVAIGHTAASPEVISAGVESGATLSTHLGNGAHGILPRHPNYIWEQLAQDNLWASIICDGHHLSPSVVQTMVRAKKPERIILVSDAVALAGLPPGKYESGGVRVELTEDGRTVLADHPELLAGATCMLDRCVTNACEFAGVGFSQAVQMATRHPRQFLGLKERDYLEEGSSANFIVFSRDVSDQTTQIISSSNEQNPSLKMQAVFLEGTLQWQRSEGMFATS